LTKSKPEAVRENGRAIVGIPKMSDLDLTYEMLFGRRAKQCKRIIQKIFRAEVDTHG